MTLCLAAGARADFASWPMLARNAVHAGSAPELAAMLSAPTWVASIDDLGAPIEFVGQSGPVVFEDLVYALGESGGVDRLYAIDRVNGSVRFSVSVERPSLDSWSTPLVDEANGAVVVASGDTARAFDARTGAFRWGTELVLNVVNASPIVTTDLGPADRLFVTDSDGFFIQGGGRLYCINVDAFDAASNPFDPGEIVWSVALNGATSGNTPAYQDGVVFVSDAGDFNLATPGRMRAFDATATTAPPPLWTFTNTIGAGFYSGVSVRDGFVYAASYTFDGGQNAANLVKLDASDGSLVWSSPSNRTDSLPIVLSDGRVLLSAGLEGFGSLPSLQLFAPDGTRLWDTALATLDGGMFFNIGGWTHVPVVVETGIGSFAYAGAPPLSGGFFGPNTELHLVDLGRAPNEPGFVLESYDSAGSTPAVADGVLYTIGATGLHAFGDFPGYAPEDVDRNCRVDIDDLHAWEAGTGVLDVNRDDVIDAQDRAALRAALRESEVSDITGGSP
ncbi:MAG: PQQ-binding-like beta-propeller repeat protein [Phycisphaerales bacterium]